MAYLRRAASDAPGSAPREDYRLWRGLAPAQKALAVVNAGRVVRVVIPASERSRLSLDYTYLQPRQGGPSGRGYFRVRDGAGAVTFRACARRLGVSPTQFAGSFIVAGAQCALIDVFTGRRAAPLIRRIPFGVPGRGCR